MKTEQSPLTANKTKAAIARGSHLFPFRTEKLNPAAPMVLRKWESRQPPPSEAGINPPIDPGLFFLLPAQPHPPRKATHSAARAATAPLAPPLRRRRDDTRLKPGAGDRPLYRVRLPLPLPLIPRCIPLIVPLSFPSPLYLPTTLASNCTGALPHIALAYPSLCARGGAVCCAPLWVHAGSVVPLTGLLG